MKITITKRNVLSYKVGQSYDVAINMGKHLIGRGLAEEVKPVIVTVEVKPVIIPTPEGAEKVIVTKDNEKVKVVHTPKKGKKTK